MRRRLSGKRILITGASSGIGEALALSAAREAMRLIVSAPDQARLELLEQLYSNIHTDCLDHQVIPLSA